MIAVYSRRGYVKLLGPCKKVRRKTIQSCCTAGDAASITIGNNTNLQDGVVISTGPTDVEQFSAATRIGSNVTVGHLASLTGVTLEDESLIGMGATLNKGVKVGVQCATICSCNQSFCLAVHLSQTAVPCNIHDEACATHAGIGMPQLWPPSILS